MPLGLRPVLGLPFTALATSPTWLPTSLTASPISLSSSFTRLALRLTSLAVALTSSTASSTSSGIPSLSESANKPKYLVETQITPAAIASTKIIINGYGSDITGFSGEEQVFGQAYLTKLLIEELA